MSGNRGWRRFSGSLRAGEESEEVMLLEIKEPVGLRVGLRPRMAMDRDENRRARSEGLGGQTGLLLLVRRPALLESRLHAPVTITGPDLQAQSCELKSVAAHPKDFLSSKRPQSPNSPGLNLAAPSQAVGKPAPLFLV